MVKIQILRNNENKQIETKKCDPVIQAIKEKQEKIKKYLESVSVIKGGSD